MGYNKGKIAIVTTVYNWDLYNKTVKSFPQDIKIYAVDGSKGLYGLESLLHIIRKLKKDKLNWLIMADEDVIFFKSENVFNLIEFLDSKNFTACGMRDGGALRWRNKNPHVLNTFFVILNLKEIYPIFDGREIRKNQYVKENEFQLNKKGLNHSNYDEKSLYEPYYCFFFWLLRKNKKIYYLNAQNPYGDETTLLFDNSNVGFLYHTWYARYYNRQLQQTKRIESVLEKGLYTNSSKPIILKYPLFHFKFFFYKYYRRFLRMLLN